MYRVGAHDATAEAQAAIERREAAEVSSGERPLIGRDAEMTLTLNLAASMISGMSHGGIIVIEGNTGAWSSCTVAGPGAWRMAHGGG